MNDRYLDLLKDKEYRFRWSDNHILSIWNKLWNEYISNKTPQNTLESYIPNDKFYPILRNHKQSDIVRLNILLTFYLFDRFDNEAFYEEIQYFYYKGSKLPDEKNIIKQRDKFLKPESLKDEFNPKLKEFYLEINLLQKYFDKSQKDLFSNDVANFLRTILFLDTYINKLEKKNNLTEIEKIFIITYKHLESQKNTMYLEDFRKIENDNPIVLLFNGFQLKPKDQFYFNQFKRLFFPYV